MMRWVLIALLAATPCSAASVPNPHWPAPADRGPDLLKSVVLKAHNSARSKFGVAPVTWSDELAAGAMAHAQYMAATGIYGHDQTPGRRKKSGENLWRGTRGVFSYDIMVGVMVDEARYFRPGAFPDNAVNGDWHSVAHYTQIVWPTTTEVGCALASSVTTDYFVCRYAPTGNKDGFFLASGHDPLAPIPASTQLAQSGD
ncbi:CAP domain-containing protein [Sphingomonas alba]|uniref:CAP domain-containing protein n=1 Tax=Sphingomonas alba TaxID=2908208 RepID=A0ABT0RK07_9SPHN|nr:CAP domain-containing protein [Sphingomonas alba]MCL6682971.1 CAP domain-containing protein [Sphingomonas alba]